MDLLRDNATKIENPYTIRNSEKSDFVRINHDSLARSLLRLRNMNNQLPIPNNPNRKITRNDRKVLLPKKEKSMLKERFSPVLGSIPAFEQIAFHFSLTEYVPDLGTSGLYSPLT